MIMEEIYRARKKLNESIEKGYPYDEIYKLSVELDELITKYYTAEENEKKKKQIKNEKISI